MGWLKLSGRCSSRRSAGSERGWAHALMRSHNPRVAAEPVIASIGALPLVVPADYVRGAGTAPGNRLNLVMRYPSMTP